MHVCVCICTHNVDRTRLLFNKPPSLVVQVWSPARGVYLLRGIRRVLGLGSGFCGFRVLRRTKSCMPLPYLGV